MRSSPSHIPGMMCGPCPDKRYFRGLPYCVFCPHKGVPPGDVPKKIDAEMEAELLAEMEKDNRQYAEDWYEEQITCNPEGEGQGWAWQEYLRKIGVKKGRML